MEELGLPERLFQTGFEPTGRKRVNNYFTLRWVELIKPALDAEYLQMLSESQFKSIMKMGGHIFSVMFVHYLLSRQLVTKKKYELWWVFSGKPVRYGLSEFALVTGLNCGQVSGAESSQKKKKQKPVKGRQKKKVDKKERGPMWEALFGDFDNPTPAWILDKLLLGKKYKDPLSRFRLALLLIVEGILCPTSGSTNIRKEVVEMVADVDYFLNYPWGRESFLLTVESAKARTKEQYVQKTTAIQGFAHAMVLVAASSCPEIVSSRAAGYSFLCDDNNSDEVEKFVVNIVSAKTIDLRGQASVKSLISDQRQLDDPKFSFADEKDDPTVSHLMNLIMEDFPFEHNSWHGGVKASEVAGDEDEELEAEETSPINVVATMCSGKNVVVNSTVIEEVDNGGRGLVRTNQVDVGLQTTYEISTLLKQLVDTFEERTANIVKSVSASLEVHIKTVMEKLKSEFEENFEIRKRDILDIQQQHSGGGYNDGGCSGAEGFPNKEPGDLVLQGTTKKVAVPSEASETDCLHKRGENVGDDESDDNILENLNTKLGKTSITGKRSIVNKVPSAEDSLYEKEKRLSKRTRSCPDRYNPSQSHSKKSRKCNRDKDESWIDGNGGVFPVSDQLISASSKIVLIGGFAPFIEPGTEKIIAFEEAVAKKWMLPLSDGSFVNADVLKPLFCSSYPILSKVMEVVVCRARVRCEHDSCSRFSFLGPEYIPNIRKEHLRFLAASDKDVFEFPTCVSFNEGNLLNVGAAAEVLYCPVHINELHWVGLSIDLKGATITVLDSNFACVSEEELGNYLAPIAEMLPYLRCGVGEDNDHGTTDKTPFVINRLDIPFLCEIPGLSAVASFVLMELHATNQLKCCSSLGDVSLKTAARCYAVDCLSLE
ncbi:unnamed protein product [Microthlaspi erraticum]|uniref:Ubiquitin-like protease family profile domain-containing protein n=1 Tax=Microthlaspi erraticum TaxID=1685480 RepID=A0A6D2L8R8_9BRAS|nr:unnamed protein product [Microthlaspi erraticum]